MPIADLSGFDMVWAIKQKTLNQQLVWLLQNHLNPSVLIGDAERDGFVIGGAAGSADEAMLASPTDASPMLELNTGQSKTARLILTFESGTISHYSGFGPGALVKTQSIKEWKICFRVNLNLGQVAHEALGSATGTIPPSIRAMLTQFDPAMFRIDSIFVDLDNADLTTYDVGASSIPTDDEFIKTKFSVGMGAWLSRFRGQDNPFILGYPVSRLEPSGEPYNLFAPSGASLSSTDAQGANCAVAVPGDATLNFLLLTGGKKITDDARYRDPGAGVFHRNLAAGTDGDGVAIISRELFFNTYLRRFLAQPLLARLLELGDYRHARDECGPELTINARSDGFKGTDTGWHFDDHVKLKWHEPSGSGDFTHDRESERRVECDVALSMQSDGGDGAHPVVNITLTQYRYEWDQMNQDFGVAGNGYLGKGWASAKLNWHMTLAFTLNEHGGFHIASSAGSDAPVTLHDTDGGYKVTDLFTGLLGLGTIADDWKRQADALGDAGAGVAAALAASTGPMLDAARMSIVMPATSVFGYTGMRLNREGDIEFALRYLPVLKAEQDG